MLFTARTLIITLKGGGGCRTFYCSGCVLRIKIHGCKSEDNICSHLSNIFGALHLAEISVSYFHLFAWVLTNNCSFLLNNQSDVAAAAGNMAHITSCASASLSGYLKQEL